MTRHTTYDPDGSAVDVRDVEEDGRTYRIVAPISSDQTARDGLSFSRDKLETFREQLASDDGPPVPLMVDHGESDLGGGSRYSVLGRVGTVDSAELTRDGDATLLRAEMSVADPDALAEEGDTGEIEAALRYLKYQAEAMGLSFSVGWDEESDRTRGPEILEVSAVAIPSDVTSSTAAAEPSAAATRGFEALPSREGASWPDNMPDGWGLRNHDPEPPSDAERAAEALDVLRHVREFHTQDDDVPHYKRRDTPPVLTTIDEVARLFGHTVSGAEVAERLEDLTESGQTHHVSDKKDVLARLDTIEEEADRLSRASRSQPRVGLRVARFPFGRSRGESRDRIDDAVATLRDVLGEGDDVSVDGWGMEAMLEARE